MLVFLGASFFWLDKQWSPPHFDEFCKFIEGGYKPKIEELPLLPRDWKTNKVSPNGWKYAERDDKVHCLDVVYDQVDYLGACIAADRYWPEEQEAETARNEAAPYNSFAFKRPQNYRASWAYLRDWYNRLDDSSITRR